MTIEERLKRTFLWNIKKFQLPEPSLVLKMKSILTCSKTLSTEQREEEYLKPGYNFTENYNQSNIPFSSSVHLDFHRS